MVLEERVSLRAICNIVCSVRQSQCQSANTANARIHAAPRSMCPPPMSAVNTRPPMRSRASRTRTREREDGDTAPASAADHASSRVRAAFRPASPAPTTTTSWYSLPTSVPAMASAHGSPRQGGRREKGQKHNQNAPEIVTSCPGELHQLCLLARAIEIHNCRAGRLLLPSTQVVTTHGGANHAVVRGRGCVFCGSRRSSCRELRLCVLCGLAHATQLIG